ncbi:MAG: hypothetical protein ABSE73_09830 [Planctomycetota bacterium]
MSKDINVRLGEDAEIRSNRELNRSLKRGLEDAKRKRGSIMATNPFVAALGQPRSQNSKYDEALGRLRQFCEAIKLYGRPALECRLEPGANTNYGLEYKVVVVTPSYTYPLLRAYVPFDGIPIKLNLNDEQLHECQDTTELDNKLVEFLKRQTTRDVLDQLRVLRVPQAVP